VTDNRASEGEIIIVPDSPEEYEDVVIQSMVDELGSVGIPVITTMTPPDLLTPLDRYLNTLEMAAGDTLPLLQQGDVELVVPRLRHGARGTS